MVNFGPRAAEIVSLVWGTPGNLNGFRVLAALLHGTLVVGVSQTLRRSEHREVWLTPTAAHYSSAVYELTSVERRRCSNEAKTRNPLKFVGVPQTGKPISAVSEPTFTIL